MDTNVEFAGIAGDWHGETGWALAALESFKKAGITHILHVGDFGIGFGHSGHVFMEKVNKRAARNGQTIYVTPGNHEDYVRIADAAEKNTREDGLIQYRSNVVLMPRGFRWEWSGRSFVSLGGANSIDREWRTLGINWWEEEQITMGDVYRTIEGGNADVMITHDCPDGVSLFGGHKAGTGNWTTFGLNYAKDSRVMLRYAVDVVRPKIQFFGHYHFPIDKVVTLGDFAAEDTYTTRFIGMDKDGSKENNIGVLDVENLTFQHLSITPMS